MNKLPSVLLAGLFLAGCGSEQSVEDSPEPNQASADVSHADANLEKIIAEAIDDSSLELRGKEGEELHYIKLHSERVITVEEVMGQKPFSGASKSMYKNGQIRFLNQYKDGKQEGHFTAWYENGKKAAEGNFKDDKEHGLWVYYNEDGTEKERKTFNDGERFLKEDQDLARIRAEEELRRTEEFGKKYGKIIAEAINLKKLERKINGGESLFYEPNEQILYSGWAKSIYDNGQIDSLLQLKDGKMDGQQALWYRNGQKKTEHSFKDGDLMSAVVWKPNGEECPHTNIVDGNGVVVGYKDNGNEQYRFFYQDGKRAF